jgi:hypothetical protein
MLLNHQIEKKTLLTHFSFFSYFINGFISYVMTLRSNNNIFGGDFFSNF